MKRLAALATAFLSATLAFSQALGTKKDVGTGTTSSSGPIVQPMDLVQMVLALIIVGVLVKWALPKAVARLGRRISTPLGSTIKLEESASFGGGQLQIVNVRGRTLLLCVASTGVSCLADLTEPRPTEDEAPVFFDMLDQADPTRAVVTTDEPEPAPEGMSMDEAISLIAAAQNRIFDQPAAQGPLDRLNRLTGS